MILVVANRCLSNTTWNPFQNTFALKLVIYLGNVRLRYGSNALLSITRAIASNFWSPFLVGLGAVLSGLFIWSEIHLVKRITSSIQRSDCTLLKPMVLRPEILQLECLESFLWCALIHHRFLEFLLIFAGLRILSCPWSPFSFLVDSFAQYLSAPSIMTLENYKTA